MMDVSYYINKLEALNVWIAFKVNERDNNRRAFSFFKEAGNMLWPIQNVEDLETWFNDVWLKFYVSESDYKQYVR